MKEKHIKINGARSNNLKNITVAIPHGKHTVITGASGSGKSTLAYDVIYASGQKKLLDCFSDQTPFASNQLKQPELNYIKGLTPVVSLKQYEPRKNPRATIGTLTEANTYLRYLFSLIGQAHCHFCDTAYPLRSLHYVLKELENLPEPITVEIQVPVYKNNRKTFDEFFYELRNNGYKHIEIDGIRKNLNDWIKIDTAPKTMMLVMDTVHIEGRLTKSIIGTFQKAIHLGDGFLRLVHVDSLLENGARSFFQKHGCIEHGMVALDIQPSFFSFNDLKSSCEDCQGTGTKKVALAATLIRDKRKSLNQGPFFSEVYNSKQPLKYVTLYSLANHFGFSFNTPFEELPEFAKNIIFYGTNGEKVILTAPSGYDKELPKYLGKIGDSIEFEGIVNWVKRYYEEKQRVEITDAEQSFFNRFLVEEICDSCHGSRLKPQRQLVTINRKNFHELGNLEIFDLLKFLEALKKQYIDDQEILSVINEVMTKLISLKKIGLGYLSLNRKSDTLSGGEYQRVRIARQLGSDLMGLTYIIDEPTVGLHGADNEKIIELLKNLCHQGNTVITIEHDLDVIMHADHIIEVGPGAGKDGGEIVVAGTFNEIKNSKKSINAPYFKTKNIDPISKVFFQKNDEFLSVLGAEENNLKKIDVSIPLNGIVCLTGVSGSGKSSLAIEILFKAFWSSLHDSRIVPGKHYMIEGMDKVEDIYCFDQKAMGRSVKSTPATFIGVFDRIRHYFSISDDAIKHNLDDASYYSFNASGGCPSCKGKGFIDTHIHYLGCLESVCSECNGERYISEVRKVLLNGKNIKQVLDMDFKTAMDFFKEDAYIYNKLKHVCDLGLDYMTLGQPTSSISGGEAQRLSLAKEISKVRGKKNRLYILDEPTTGLHPKDVEKLMLALKNIVEKGNSMLIIEHNPEVIINADYIIDLGPEAGKNGGNVVVSGSLTDIMACPDSKTGRYLKTYFDRTNDSDK